MRPAFPRSAVPARTYVAEKGDMKLDRMNALYCAEYDRWCWRRKNDKSGYELVRNVSPNNDINADEFFEITDLSKLGCHDSICADMWFETLARRAAMRAALEEL